MLQPFPLPVVSCQKVAKVTLACSCSGFHALLLEHVHDDAVFPAPDELGIQVGVAGLFHRAWRFLLLSDDKPVYGGGNVFPLVAIMLDRFVRFESGGHFGRERGISQVASRGIAIRFWIVL